MAAPSTLHRSLELAGTLPALMVAADRVAATVIQGRLAPSVDDVVALAGPILRHRMAVNFSARAEGVTVESVIAQMCARLG